VELGVSRRFGEHQVRTGRWDRLGPGVFRLRGSPVTLEQRIMAAVLAGGDGSVASHRTAAYLWGITTSKRVPIEISIPRGTSRGTQAGVIAHTSTDLHLAPVEIRNGISVTGLARTLLDLGAVDRRAVRRAVMRARRTHGLGWDELLVTLIDHSRRGRPGLGALREVLGVHYGELSRDSDTEDLAWQIMLDSGRVPMPDAQVKVVCADGVEVDIDFGWPQWRVYLEVFGVDHLTNEDLQHLDLHRRNQIELADNRLLIYTGRLLRRQPDQFITDVLRQLRAGGWDGAP
jgi:hypothetical protein